MPPRSNFALPGQPAQHERVAAPHKTRRNSSPIRIARANGTDSARCQSFKRRRAKEGVEGRNVGDAGQQQQFGRNADQHQPVGEQPHREQALRSASGR